MAARHAAGALKLVKYDANAVLASRERVLARRGARDLVDVMSTFDLRPAAAAKLFGVTRQAVVLWLARGEVPAARIADLSRIAQAARAMRAFFRPERIPEIARKPSPGLDGRSVLDVARTEPERIVELVAATRAYVPQP